MLDYQKLGQWFLVRKLITAKQLADAIEEHRETRRRLGEVLIRRGWATEEQVSEALAEQYAMKVVNPSKVKVDRDILALIPYATAESRLILLYAKDERGYHAVISDPLDIDLLDALQSSLLHPIKLYMATPTALRKRIRRVYEVRKTVKDVTQTKTKIDPQSDRAELLEVFCRVSGGAA